MVKLRSEAMTWQAVDDEIVCLDLATSEYISINVAGTALWPQLLTGEDEAALATTLVDTFGIDEQTARRDVETFLDTLRSKALLETG